MGAHQPSCGGSERQTLVLFSQLPSPPQLALHLQLRSLLQHRIGHRDPDRDWKWYWFYIVGTHLSSHEGDQHTFLSRDAGQTWSHIAEGSHIYDMGDFGGLLIMAKDQEETREIKFSWDEGMTWESVSVDQDVRV